MPSVIADVALVLLILSSVFQLLGKLRISCCLLLAFPMILTAVALLSLLRDPARLGGAEFRNDENQAIFCVGLLALSVLAVLRPGWRWLFWIAWLLNALACAILVYLAFFWHVFS